MRFFWLLLVSAATIQQPPLPPQAPPGRLIDIGGWRLHLNCTGAASASRPTVILEAGVGDFSVEWSLVQPPVASFARVCSYDRAGDGWSDLGPHPRTMHQIVYELHALLERAGERPPYVLVGHSYGGVLVRLFSSTYRAEVAGMLLVDAGEDDPVRLTANGTEVRASTLPAGRQVPAVQTSRPLRISDIPDAALTQMRAGLPQAVATANEGPRAKLPKGAQQMRTWALGRVEHIAAAVNPFELEELAALRAERSASDHPYGDLPLVVLTRGLSDETGPNAKRLADEHLKDHAAIAALSRSGRQIIATKSGHHIQLDEPELVVMSIRNLLMAGRR